MNVHKKLTRVRRLGQKFSYLPEGVEYTPDNVPILPFVVGVVGDFSGTRARSQPDELSGEEEGFRFKNFVHIDRDNFEAVMGIIAPKLSLEVEDTLAADGTKIRVSLTAIARRYANGPMIAVVTQAATPHLGSHSGVSFAMEVPSWLMPSFPKLTNTFN